MPIRGRHVLDVAYILQPSLYLEASDTCIHHRFEVAEAIHVAKREQVLVLDKRPTFSIFEREGQSAELGALATIGRTAETVLRGIATPAIRDAEGTVDEDFEAGLRNGLMDVAYLVEREFASQHNLFEALFAEPRHLLCGTVVHLCACMEGNGRQKPLSISPEGEGTQGHILNDEGICSSVIEVPCYEACLLQFVGS